MKKTYSKPAAAGQEIYTSAFIAGSTTINMGKDIEQGTTDAGKNRSEWGNLWNK